MSKNIDTKPKNVSFKIWRNYANINTFISKTQASILRDLVCRIPWLDEWI